MAGKLQLIETPQSVWHHSLKRWSCLYLQAFHLATNWICFEYYFRCIIFPFELAVQILFQKEGWLAWMLDA